jgi:hypothetical protein
MLINFKKLLKKYIFSFFEFFLEIFFSIKKFINLNYFSIKISVFIRFSSTRTRTYLWLTWTVYRRVIMGIFISENASPTTFFDKRSLKKPKRDRGNTLANEKQKEFEEIGGKIVRKCQGFPLAMKAMGGILHDCIDVSKWRQIQRSEIWEIEDGDPIKTFDWV